MGEDAVPVNNAANQDEQMPDRVVEWDPVAFLVEENATSVEEATNKQPQLDWSTSHLKERISAENNTPAHDRVKHQSVFEELRQE